MLRLVSSEMERNLMWVLHGPKETLMSPHHIWSSALCGPLWQVKMVCVFTDWQRTRLSNSHFHFSQCLTLSVYDCVCVLVTQSCLTLCNPMGYTVHGIPQARILEWVAIPFSKGSSQPRLWTQVSHIAGSFFTSWATREAQCIWLAMFNVSITIITIPLVWEMSSGKQWHEIEFLYRISHSNRTSEKLVRAEVKEMAGLHSIIMWVGRKL